MKIERISDNQIKCTLSRSDLASRQLKVSELAYGSDKTRDLFHDMMEQASNEVGFDASDTPLMIEAIPVSMDCIVLMITKVDNPDEVDTDFSRFSNLKDLLADTDSHSEDGLFQDDREKHGETAACDTSDLRKAFDSDEKLERMFSFGDLDSVINFAHKVGTFSGESTLYKSPDNGRFYLVLGKASLNVKEFSFVCNSALEFGSKEPFGFARRASIDEHFELICSEALRKLANV